MSKILERLVSQLQAKGHSKEAAHRIALSSLIRAGDLDKHGKPTPKGIRRGNMSPSERAISRQAKYTGRRASDFKYNPKTNRAVLRKHG